FGDVTTIVHGTCEAFEIDDGRRVVNMLVEQRGAFHVAGSLRKGLKRRPMVVKVNIDGKIDAAKKAQTTTLSICYTLAGAGGLEPPNGGIKIRCLTTWLRPSRAARLRRGRARDHSGRKLADQRQQGRRPRLPLTEASPGLD